MFEYMTYENVEKKYGLKNHTRKCIDGKITSCGNCVGYCMYCEHSGFLTKELRKKHNRYSPWEYTVSAYQRKT